MNRIGHPMVREANWNLPFMVATTMADLSVPGTSAGWHAYRLMDVHSQVVRRTLE